MHAQRERSARPYGLDELSAAAIRRVFDEDPRQRPGQRVCAFTHRYARQRQQRRADDDRSGGSRRGARMLPLRARWRTARRA